MGGRFKEAAHVLAAYHGRTGYLCRDQDEMTAAVARLPQISRRHCRAAAEQRFSQARMAADYDRLYRAILERPGRSARTNRNGRRTMTVPADPGPALRRFHPERTGGAAPRAGPAPRPDGATGGDFGSGPGTVAVLIRAIISNPVQSSWAAPAAPAAWADSPGHQHATHRLARR